jgi:hypothetical protein
MMQYVAQRACGVAHMSTIALGDSWPALGVARFVVLIIAIVSDGELDRPSP